MTREEHLLTILAEECCEVAHRVSKALRFGLAEIQPGQALTNAQRIMAEVQDFLAVYQMIAGPVVSPISPLFRGDPAEWMAALRAKQAKVERYLAFSAGRGLVDGVAADPTVPHPETAESKS